MLIHAIPSFSDNYIWLITLDQQGHSLIVDPGDPAPVLAALKEKKLKPIGILITHHHWDHTHGIKTIYQHYPIPVYGPTKECTVNTTLLTSLCINTDGNAVAKKKTTCTLSETTFQIFQTPGHTLDHQTYYFPNEGLLFPGDTLFSAGCGRLFEGTHEQLYTSLMQLTSLPTATKIYCAHEYTLTNLHFAHMLEPDNTEIISRLDEVHDQRNRNAPTLPSTLAIEQATNPFLRCHLPSIKQAAENFCQHSLDTPLAIFTIIRQWKDTWQSIDV